MSDVNNGGGGAMSVWGQGVYGKSLYLPLNFVVNLKLLFKIVFKKIIGGPKYLLVFIILEIITEKLFKYLLNHLKITVLKFS